MHPHFLCITVCAHVLPSIELETNWKMEGSQCYKIFLFSSLLVTSTVMGMYIQTLLQDEARNTKLSMLVTQGLLDTPTQYCNVVMMLVICFLFF